MMITQWAESPKKQSEGV